MSCAFRTSSLAVIKCFFIFKLFCAVFCESPGYLQSDYFLNQEVVDFQNWLNEKISNHEIEIPQMAKPLTEHQENPQHYQEGENLPHFDTDDWDKSNEESDDLLYEDVQETLTPRGSGEPQLTSAENVPQSNLLHQNDGIDVHEVKISSNAKGNHHPVKEILYIRESDSDSTISLSDFLKEALSSKESADEPIEPKEPDYHSRESLSQFLHKALSRDQLLPDTCSVTNHSFNDGQTCSSSPQYRLEPHLSATFSEDLKAQMLERYSIGKDSSQPVCGFRRRMRPDKDVIQRALCPFQWVVSERNPSRIPEYLYEAKCSCLNSCAELKSKIRVLWRVGCDDALHVYKEGWEEIAVACVPTEPPIIQSKRAFVVGITPPE
ncbi:Interleukin cytokine-related protein 17.1 like protein [Argiope bruennichi]|uniref:Interleukin cytokine-related protein 17.1 like protein n=1 Tax=Argiope bruennichi TaxID=94029 RepID=A0A8T0FRL0_ARGBR|nr:Interleukin cytokine-related protein 17.1 like protein [Argiope bruennichi]